MPPISVLNLDLKIFANVLAIRLEPVLPLIVKNDQIGFLRGQYSTHSVRRLLNIIQHSSLFNPEGFVISLDAEKALDHLELPFLYFTLQEFGPGDIFIKWFQILYTSPLSANCRSSGNFNLLNVTVGRAVR